MRRHQGPPPVQRSRSPYPSPRGHRRRRPSPSPPPPLSPPPTPSPPSPTLLHRRGRVRGVEAVAEVPRGGVGPQEAPADRPSRAGPQCTTAHPRRWPARSRRRRSSFSLPSPPPSPLSSLPPPSERRRGGGGSGSPSAIRGRSPPQSTPWQRLATSTPPPNGRRRQDPRGSRESTTDRLSSRAARRRQRQHASPPPTAAHRRQESTRVPVAAPVSGHGGDVPGRHARHCCHRSPDPSRPTRVPSSPRQSPRRRTSPTRPLWRPGEGGPPVRGSAAAPSGVTDNWQPSADARIARWLNEAAATAGSLSAAAAQVPGPGGRDDRHGASLADGGRHGAQSGATVAAAAEGTAHGASLAANVSTTPAAEAPSPRRQHRLRCTATHRAGRLLRALRSRNEAESRAPVGVPLPGWPTPPRPHHAAAAAAAAAGNGVARAHNVDRGGSPPLAFRSHGGGRRGRRRRASRDGMAAVGGERTSPGRSVLVWVSDEGPDGSAHGEPLRCAFVELSNPPERRREQRHLWSRPPPEVGAPVNHGGADAPLASLGGMPAAGVSCRRHQEGLLSATTFGAAPLPRAPPRCGGNNAAPAAGYVRSRRVSAAAAHHGRPAIASRGIGGVPRHLRARLPRAVIPPLRGTPCGGPPTARAGGNDAPCLPGQAATSGPLHKPAAKAMPSAAVAGAGSLTYACAICLEGLAAGETACRLPCMHAFHDACIGRWLVDHRRCPLDATDVVALLRVYG